MTIDFSSEAADTYIETVRLADSAGVLHTLPHRPPADAAEADQAAAVRRRIGRSVFSLSPRPDARRAPGQSDAPHCAVCGGSDDLRLWRQVWLSDSSHSRLDLYRCRGGCAHSDSGA